MQTICTSLQTDNHTNTSSLNFCRPDAFPDAQPTVPKHWQLNIEKYLLNLSDYMARVQKILNHSVDDHLPVFVMMFTRSASTIQNM